MSIFTLADVGGSSNEEYVVIEADSSMVHAVPGLPTNSGDTAVRQVCSYLSLIVVREFAAEGRKLLLMVSMCPSVRPQHKSSRIGLKLGQTDQRTHVS